MRIVSLLPSATEIVCALGGEDELAGVSHECDYPRTVSQKTVMTASRLPGADSLSIDQAVRDAIEQALSIYSVKTRQLADAAPDLVITQDLCEVCALPASTLERALKQIARPDTQLIRLSPRSVADVLGDIKMIANAIGRESQGLDLCRALDRRINKLNRDSLDCPNERKSVLAIEWLQPLMLGGLWTPELIALAGGVSVIAKQGEPAPTIGPEMLDSLAPDIVLIKPCGYKLEQSEAEAGLIGDIVRPHWPAARSGSVYVVDGNQYFNRSGPRLIDSAELLHGIINANLDTAWRTRFGSDVARFDWGHRPGLARLVREGG